MLVSVQVVLLCRLRAPGTLLLSGPSCHSLESYCWTVMGKLMRSSWPVMALNRHSASSRRPSASSLLFWASVFAAALGGPGPWLERGLQGEGPDLPMGARGPPGGLGTAPCRRVPTEGHALGAACAPISREAPLGV